MSHQPLYLQRFQRHIAHANTYFRQGDYIQAGEKIWGALSALINSRSLIEIKSVRDKKTNFLRLFRAYQHANQNIIIQMNQAGFRTEIEVWHSINGLHKYFYGGRSHPPQQIQVKMPFIIQLLNSL